METKHAKNRGNIILQEKNKLNLQLKIGFPNSYVQERSLWTEVSQYTKKEGMALPVLS